MLNDNIRAKGLYKISLKKKNKKKFIFDKKKKIHKIIKLFFARYTYFRNKADVKYSFFRKLSLLNLSMKSKLINLFKIERVEFDAKEKKNLVRGIYRTLLKKRKIEKSLSLFLNNSVELKLKNFLKSCKTSFKFKRVYENFYNDLRLNKINFFNRQFKEIYSSLSIGLFISKSKLIVYLLCSVIGFGRYRLLKKNLYYLFNVLEALQKVYAYHHCLRVNISGKFKGKAKRTQLKYLKTPGLWEVRTVNNSLLDYHVGFVGTRTGTFGIKVWIN